jgi:prefoldin subunit 4
MAQFGTMRKGVNVQRQDTHIEREDQDKINQFSRMNMRFHEVKDDIKKIKEDIENLDDAAQQVEESLGDELKLFLGECFVTVDEDGATNYVEKLQDEKSKELDRK